MPDTTNSERENARALEPVEYLPLPDESRPPEPGIALCLSGGGYRAMLFHAGALWRLWETGVLGRTARISSVSGGSVAAGVLALAWHPLFPPGAAAPAPFEEAVVGPLRGLARESIDVAAVIGGILLPGSSSEKLEAAYRRHLFGAATLGDLPPRPRFVINATNVQSGALWRFSRASMRDYRVGELRDPGFPLARAVAASSAFPPALSPMVMEVDPAAFTPGSGQDLQHEPYTRRVVLTDGGVYDNLGLETAWKRCRTILVSDAGGTLRPEAEPHEDWLRHGLRVLELIDHQVRSLRKRLLIASYRSGARQGAYWGIRTDISHYRLAEALPCPRERTIALADTPTRLQRLAEDMQERLVNWGYAVCDAALRRHLDPALPPPAGFPYPATAV